MSHSAHSDICENVLACSDLHISEEVDDFINGYCDASILEWMHGWSLIADQLEHGKKKRIFGEFVAKKDGHEVYLINSSQYCNVCEYDFTAFGKREAVEAFWIDFADMIPKYSKIEDTDTVEQWS